MARKGKGDRTSEEVNRIFEKQQRRLNRKRFARTIFGIGFLVALVLALQLTPYRDLPREIFDSAVQWVTGLFAGPDAPEPNPKYW